MKQARRPRTPRWTTIGLVTREYSALRLEIIAGPVRGTYHVSAEDVGPLLDDREIVPLYQIRTRQGEDVPLEAGFCYHADTGRMVIARFDGGFRAMIPAGALRKHYDSPEANRPTRIAAPTDAFEADRPVATA
jgi:hypothetical protein